jgi:hypothetical protein
MFTRPRVRLIVFHAILFGLVAVMVELMAAAAYSIAFRESFSYRTLQAVRHALLDPSKTGPRPGDQLAYWVVHPYYGFVTNPEPIGWSVNEFGFFGSENQIQRADPDKLVVAVVGGSVATQFAHDDYTAETLRSELRKIPAFHNKQVVILNLGNGSYKQPQALFVVSDIISRGGHIDVLIALDGFNEIALPEAHGNVGNGISPFFPQSWRQLADGRPSRSQLNFLAKSQISADVRLRLASIFSKPILRYLITANLVWRMADVQLARLEMLYRAEAQEQPPVNPGSRLSNDKRAFLGPIAEYGTRRDLYLDIAGNWARSSILLNSIISDQGGIYVHFLQPNQYVPGSKPLTENEKRNAISADSSYKRPVETAYPYLRAVGQNLSAAGVWFEDLTNVFAQTEQDLYVDNCCHLNKTGYDILVRKVVATLAAHIEKDVRNRPVAVNAVDFDESIFSAPALRAIAATPHYQDGSEEPIRRAATTASLGKTSDWISPESWHAMGSGSYRIRGDAVLMQGQNQLFTVRDCPTRQCKVAFSVDVRQAENAHIGLYFINDKGRVISESQQAISGVQGEARLELVAPASTRKVRAFIHSQKGVVELAAAALIVKSF